MGKHTGKNPAEPARTPGNVTDDTWTRIISAAVEKKDEGWFKGAVRNAENARNN